MRVARLIPALLVAVALLVLPAPSGIYQGTSSASAQGQAYGPWNGVVSFEIVSNYGTDPKIESQDSRAYTVHGATATMSGQGRLVETRADGYLCGETKEGWGWKGGGAVPSPSVTVDNQGISFGFPPVNALYVHTSSGGIRDGTICHPLPHQPADTAPTGIGGFGWNKKGKRADLLRTSGSATVSHSGGGNPNPNALPGSLSYPATITVTWNLKRIGPDRDHDGLSDQGDRHPNDADSDNDGYPDGWEVDHGTGPNSSNSHPHGDWTNGAPDSDGDRWSDAVEIGKGTDPHDKSSHPTNPPQDSTPIDPKKPPWPPDNGGGGKQEHGWSKRNFVTACPARVIVVQRCTIVLSPRSTAVAAASWLENDKTGSPTLQQEILMCRKLFAIPDPVRCAESNFGLIAALFDRISFSKSMQVAAAPGRFSCFYFVISRSVIHVKQVIRYGEPKISYNYGAYELTQGETAVFNGKNVRCAVRPGGNDPFVYLEV